MVYTVHKRTSVSELAGRRRIWSILLWVRRLLLLLDDFPYIALSPGRRGFIFPVCLSSHFLLQY